MGSPKISKVQIQADAELVELAEAMHAVWSSFTKHRHDCAAKTSVALEVRPYEGTPRQGVWAMGRLESGPLRMTELAEAVGASLASTSGVVDRLAQRGFVRRVPSQEDRRVVTVELTDEGREALVAFKGDMIGRLSMLVDPLEKDERVELTRLLKKLSPGG